MTTKFSEASTVSQISQILGLVVGMFGLFGAALYAWADQSINAKYATDDDLATVQRTVNATVTRIETTVIENTKTVQATATSVDGLTLVVLGLQIDDLESDIIDLEAEKRREAAGWSERDENNLRKKQRALDDLEAQKAALMAPLLGGTP